MIGNFKGHSRPEVLISCPQAKSSLQKLSIGPMSKKTTQNDVLIGNSGPLGLRLEQPIICIAPL